MIQKKKKICKNCNKETFLWKAGLCKSCSSILSSPKKIVYKSAKQKIKDIEKKERTKKLHEWFLELFDKRSEKDSFGKYVICFESGKKLYEQYYKYNTCCYSHYFPKSKYPELAFEEWNLEIVEPEIHAKWEINKDKCPKMYKKFNTELINKNLSLQHENNNIDSR